MSFLSTLSLRRATTHVIICVPERANFYPRSPCGERRAVPSRRTRARQISIHALLAESDVLQSALDILTDEFLSTLSLRRATVGRPCNCCTTSISIHALLAESDPADGKWTRRQVHFYPRSPCGERPHVIICAPERAKFLSTLSLRRATQDATPICQGLQFLSTLSLRRATKTQRPYVKDSNFYPRPPCGERPPLADGAQPDAAFLSTLSLRRATQRGLFCYRIYRYFYPRSPCGERPGTNNSKNVVEGISIHALLAESDLIAKELTLAAEKFLSTLSLRRATDTTYIIGALSTFLSTLSLRRATAAARHAEQ